MTDFKEQGNRLFSERRYTEAIEAYTAAIVRIHLKLGNRICSKGDVRVEC